MESKQNLTSLIYSLSAVFLWSTVASAFKLTLEGVSFAQLLFYASSVSSIILFLILLFNRNVKLKELFKVKTILKSIALGLLNPFLYYLILFKAYSLLPAQEAQPLNFTWPIILSLFSVLFLKQKINSKAFIGLASAFIGVIIIATRGNIFTLQFHDLFGVSLALGSSIIWASFWILNLLDKQDNSIKLFGAFFFGTIFTGIYIYLFDSFKLADYSYLLGAGYVGLFEMGVTFFLWNKGLELSKNKIKTSTLAYLSPFISLIFIAIVVGETIRLSSVLGLLFIIGGILYQNLSDINLRRSKL